MISALICSLAAFTMMSAAGETEVVCLAPEAAQAVWEGPVPLGWYDGDTDQAFVVEGQSFRYSQEILAHELAHAWDLKKGTAVNGFPSFFSETHTGFDVEEFARLQTLVSGWWPRSEAFPDDWAHQERFTRDVATMHLAGWLMDGEEAVR